MLCVVCDSAEKIDDLFGSLICWKCLLTAAAATSSPILDPSV